MYLIERFERWAGTWFRFSESDDAFYEIHPLRVCREDCGCQFRPYFAYRNDCRVRHPIMYLLFYRWWILRSMPRKDVSERCYYSLSGPFEQEYREWDNLSAAGCNAKNIVAAFWARAALYHPILVMLWIFFRTFCKLLEKALTFPIKKAFCVWEQSGKSMCHERKATNIPFPFEIWSFLIFVEKLYYVWRGNDDGLYLT